MISEVSCSSWTIFILIEFLYPRSHQQTPVFTCSLQSINQFWNRFLLWIVSLIWLLYVCIYMYIFNLYLYLRVCSGLYTILVWIDILCIYIYTYVYIYIDSVYIYTYIFIPYLYIDYLLEDVSKPFHPYSVWGMCSEHRDHCDSCGLCLGIWEKLGHVFRYSWGIEQNPCWLIVIRSYTRLYYIISTSQYIGDDHNPWQGNPVLNHPVW
jgi:hypothetical protein